MNLEEEMERDVTREWLELFNGDKAAGEDFADSVFWRLAVDVLPLGVDPKNAEVQSAQREICAALDRRDFPHGDL